MSKIFHAARYAAAALFIASCSSEPEVAEPKLETSTVTITESETVSDVTPMINTSFIPADFNAPTEIIAGEFKLVPLGPDLVKIDYEAYMSSIQHLQETFTRNTNWPHEGITDADAMLDMETEQARFENRESFAYAVLTLDGSRERGCVYVYPSKIDGYDAVIRLWVTKDEFDQGFDAELYDWTQTWIKEDWPFENVAYPGRAIEWASWDNQVAAQEQKDEELTATNVATAEAFIDTFYSFDATKLKTFLETADETAEGILYYQGWAEGGNYIVMERGACEAESPTLIRCPITVQDDPVVALKTGFNVTDTFHITFSETDIASIDTSSNDQPIYYEARKWVEKNMPEVMAGPCSDRGTSSGTPQDCARAMTEGYKRFYAATRGGNEAD